MLESNHLDTLPRAKGAYILDILVPHPFSCQNRAKKEFVFAPGRYLYCGSARGSGGLKARLTRHCRRDKKPHWHIDPLTLHFGVQALYFCEDQTECDLVATLIQTRQVQIPFAGFGSSDCTVCDSHLLQAQGLPDLKDLFNPAQVLGPVS